MRTWLAPTHVARRGYSSEFTARKKVISRSTSHRWSARLFQFSRDISHASWAILLRTWHTLDGYVSTIFTVGEFSTGIFLLAVLNSLSIDPGQIWKGNWRFFDEQTLRTCDRRKPKNDPLQNIIDEGMTFEEFLYLAECNGASIVPYLASHSTLAQFRSAILAACTRRLDELRLVCSYNRSTLQQTGTGHFSPIAAYHADEDLILILDVARFKYPVHWIPIDLLWQSMCTIDSATGKSRGFYLVAKWPTDFSISCNVDPCQSTDELVPPNNRSLSSPEESLQFFIDDDLRAIADTDVPIQELIVSLLRALTPLAIQLATKWTFDIMQKYRLKAVAESRCVQDCSCINMFQSYPTFLPEIVNANQVTGINECKKPCARVTRSHVHAYGMPTRCALDSFVDLFNNSSNQKLYHRLEQMRIEQYLTINDEKAMYLFGGVSSIVDDDGMITRIERGLTTIFLYALRTDQFLATMDLFNWTGVSSELKEEILYAKACFGVLW